LLLQLMDGRGRDGWHFHQWSVLGKELVVREFTVLSHGCRPPSVLPGREEAATN
jgi:hypothetical protein